jgi:hypothetical protein
MRYYVARIPMACKKRGDAQYIVIMCDGNIELATQLLIDMSTRVKFPETPKTRRGFTIREVFSDGNGRFIAANVLC